MPTGHREKPWKSCWSIMIDLGRDPTTGRRGFGGASREPPSARPKRRCADFWLSLTAAPTASRRRRLWPSTFAIGWRMQPGSASGQTPWHRGVAPARLGGVACPDSARERRHPSATDVRAGVEGDVAPDTGPGGRPAGSVPPAAPEREASRAGKLPSCCRLLQHLAARCRLLAPMPLDPSPLVAIVIPTPMCSDPFRCTDWAYGSYVLYAVWRFRRARWMGSSHFGSPPVFGPLQSG